MLRRRAVLKQICEEAFDPRLVTVVEGGRAENEALLDERWDKIFFTGSVSVGKLVMERASKNLTPVTLELGGKSPCIVDRTADIHAAARRIVFGKFLNCGQTCVAPDYVLCHESIRDRLVKELTRQIDYFLDTLDAESRILFVRRYWYAYSISELAKQFGLKSNTVSVRLSRIRDKLRDYLKGEGFTV